MKNILVIGATGQIGSELTLELRKRYGDDHVVAGYIPSAMPQGELKDFRALGYRRCDGSSIYRSGGSTIQD